RERLVCREPLLLARAAAQRDRHTVGDRPDQAVGKLRPLDLFLHQLAQRRALEHVLLEPGGSRRVARPVDALESRAEELVLLGIRKELYLVDGPCAGIVPMQIEAHLGHVISALCGSRTASNGGCTSARSSRYCRRTMPFPRPSSPSS